jgi:hypothetical protein
MDTMPSATSTLATLGGTIINTVVSLAQVIFTTYWPYILVFGVIISLAIWGKRLIGVGHK